MGPLRAVGVCVAAAVLAWSAPVGAETPSDDGKIAAKVHLLDVPYVPQSGSLCGGAALAMVFRFWGKPDVLAEDFAALLETGQAGIRTGALVKAVEDRGWTALPLPGTPDEVQSQLAQGRPVIALIRAGPGSYHYVVLVAWANAWVVVHDPNASPFRSIRESDFISAWSGSADWALLVLPPRETREESAPDSATAEPLSPATSDDCAAMVEAGIVLARQGNTAEAERKFEAAQTLCPASAAPLRERAGLRFRAEDWVGASRLAERALALDPNDALAWRLLAGSRFLAGDVDNALRAWNHLSEPRSDLTRIDGLSRTRYSAVAHQVDLPPGRLLTPQAFRQARRRLADMPAQSGFRLGLKPLPGGNAQVNVTLLERPLVLGSPWDIGRAGAKAILGREAVVDVASPMGNGELWTARWRWWAQRPRVSVALATPAPGGRPGIWRVEGFWERQAYATSAHLIAIEAAPAATIREERRRTSLSYADWLGPDLRLAIGVAMDEWADRGAHLALDGGLETRWARNHLAVGADAARWISLKNTAPFGTAGLSLKWCSNGLEVGDGWHALLGLSSATAEAPLALWSGAGTGSGRAPLLRAHPLLNGGVLQGRVFGRTLAHGTIEKQTWVWTIGPLRLGWAVFVDGAKPWHTGQAGRVPWQVDGGTGLRIRGPGMKGQLRIDAARGLEDGSSALSVAWEVG